MALWPRTAELFAAAPMRIARVEFVRIPARIAEIRQETPTIKSFVIDYGEAPFEFLAGQWIDLYAEIGGELRVGGYSMTSSPLRRGSIELAIKYSDSHALTHFLHARARVGDRVWISQGSGEFYFREGMAERLVLIGAGIGVTPMLSILRYVAEAAPEVDATLLYGVAVAEEILFREELERLASERERIRLLITVSQPSPGWPGRRGRIDAAAVQEAGLDVASLYYLCGPPGMVEETALMLESLGIPSERIRYEKWW